MSLISAMIKTYKGNNLEQGQVEKLQNKRLKELVKYARNIMNMYLGSVLITHVIFVEKKDNISLTIVQRNHGFVSGVKVI